MVRIANSLQLMVYPSLVQRSLYGSELNVFQHRSHSVKLFALVRQYIYGISVSNPLFEVVCQHFEVLVERRLRLGVVLYACEVVKRTLLAKLNRLSALHFPLSTAFAKRLNLILHHSPVIANPYRLFGQIVQQRCLSYRRSRSYQIDLVNFGFT